MEEKFDLILSRLDDLKSKIHSLNGDVWIFGLWNAALILIALAAVMK